MRLELHTPCESFHDPDEDLLREIFVDDPQQYWHHCPGNAGLHYFDRADRAQLILQFEAGRGYYVTYHRPGMPSEHEIRTGDGPGGTVTLWLSGEHFDVYASAFVPIDVAWRAIDAFVRDGRVPELPDGYSWVPNGRL